MNARVYRFGEFEFDGERGTLRRPGSESAAEVRLPPQPSRLLLLLLSRPGEVVTREEIRDAIWPDVQVEFDSSLHFCIRQIRSALGDSAGESRYVETLPRRGYRLMPEVRVEGAGIESPALPPDRPVATSPDPTPARRRRIPLLLTLALVGAAALVAAILSGVVGPESMGEPQVRVGVMPFRPPAGTSVFGDVPAIAEWVLEELDRVGGKRLALVGPTTTSVYDDSGGALRQLAERYELDFIVNGRFIEDGEGPRMLAELIRVSDGAHIWVRSYTPLADGRRIGEEIGRIVAAELEIAP